MSDFSLTNPSKKNEFSTVFLSDFFHLCSSIVSHPLYFSYFIFFSPYLIKLLSFLSPLFFTTTLVLLVLLTLSPNLVFDKGASEFSESELGFVFSVYKALVERLKSKSGDEKDEETGFLEEIEAYLVMFQSSIFEAWEPKSQDSCSEGFDQESYDDSEEKPVEKNDHKVEESQETKPIAELKSLESLFQENTELKALFSQEEEKEVKPLDPEFEKVEERKEGLPWRRESKVMSIVRSIDAKVSGNSDEDSAGTATAVVNTEEKVNSTKVVSKFGSPNGEYTRKVMVNNQSLSPNLGTFGSMRKEKEWRRTLACKLFEERHHVDGSEGMDMLWETYETESTKVQQRSNSKKGKKEEVDYNDDDEEDEEDDEIDGNKLCCLQALKFSTGKMNLGMGRPNLQKISKALKGIGWLHHHVGRHGRKQQQGDR
ncbi:hypothetical protein L6164_003183 [Bauhinia variegata]|uniref:Uncharacterized protein n=1 Tax=Bauhinia variegata TaxID=167791 RepID=A0ACB9Q221_BAUVA|nr:hypothetical protein L6164_003183 [Bauhinia variegata]